jgi:hypothetical protein
VKVSARVTGVSTESKDVRVQIALIEKRLRYTGENGIRFHPMVVRAMGGKDAEGFSLARDTEKYGQTFDLARVSAALEQGLNDYESKGHAGESFHFRRKLAQIDPDNLAIVVFVQDDQSKHVLEAAYVDLAPTQPQTATENSK